MVGFFDHKAIINEKYQEKKEEKKMSPVLKIKKEEIKKLEEDSKIKSNKVKQKNMFKIITKIVFSLV